MRVEELRRLAIFESLSDERLEQLLSVGRQTLAQVTEINRKLPLPPAFPATR